MGLRRESLHHQRRARAAAARDTRLATELVTLRADVARLAAELRSAGEREARLEAALRKEQWRVSAAKEAEAVAEGERDEARERLDTLLREAEKRDTNPKQAKRPRSQKPEKPAKKRPAQPPKQADQPEGQIDRPEDEPNQGADGE